MPAELALRLAAGPTAVFAIAFTHAVVGLGGGLLYFPLLTLIFPAWTPPAVVFATLLLSVGTLAVPALTHHRQGLTRVRLGLGLGVVMAGGAVAGSWFTLRAQGPVVEALFAIVLLGIAARMAFDLLRPDGARAGPTSQPGKGRRLLVFLLAGSAGFLTGSVGIGGGAVLVPLLTYGLGLPTREATGTAAFALLLAALAALASYLRLHELPLPPALLAVLAVAALAGATGGARMGLARLRGRHVRAVFVAVLVLASLLTGGEAVARWLA